VNDECPCTDRDDYITLRCSIDWRLPDECNIWPSPSCRTAALPANILDHLWLRMNATAYWKSIIIRTTELKYLGCILLAVCIIYLSSVHMIGIVLYTVYWVSFITGPPNWPVLFCSLVCIVCRRRLSSSVTLPAGERAGRPPGVGGRTSDTARRASTVMSR